MTLRRRPTRTQLTSSSEESDGYKGQPDTILSAEDKEALGEWLLLMVGHNLCVDLVMVLVKATKSSEAGEMPSEQFLSQMGKFNEELIKAGVMLAGEGLHPSSQGVRVKFSGTERIVTDGPFAETKELVAGFWLWEVDSMEDAVAWVKRCPNPMLEDSEIEIRPIFGPDDFGDALTPELREQEERHRAQLEQ